MIEKIFPQDIEAERAVLGAMLMDKDVIHKAMELLDNASFYRVAHQRIYQAIITLYEKNEPVDIVTLSEQLQHNNELASVGGAVYLITLLNSVPTSANIEYYANIVKEKTDLRVAINIVKQIEKQAFENNTDSEEIFASITDITNITQRECRHKRKKRYKTFFEIREQVIQLLKNYGNGAFSGVPTGFYEIDNRIGGLHKELTIIAGSPSVGKTTFCMNLMYRMIQQGIKVGFISLEMPADILWTKLCCMDVGCNFELLRKGILGNDHKEAMFNSLDKVFYKNLTVVDKSGIENLTSLKTVIRQMKDSGIQIIFLDYLQRLPFPESRESRAQQVSRAVKETKNLIDMFKIPIVVISSLRNNGSVKPQLEDLKESGDIGYEADLVLLLHRDRKKTDNLISIEVAKQRHGSYGLFELLYLYDGGLYVDCEREYDNPRYKGGD